MLTVKQNGGLLIVRDEEGRMVRKLNAVAAAKDWLKLGAAEFYKKYGFRFHPCKPGAPPAWRRGAYGQGGEHGYIEHNQASAGGM